MTSISIAPRKNLTPQQISISNGLTVFIGSNGAGKSSMLEALFEQLSSDSQLIVAFTSGPNENFTKIYDKLRKPLRWNIESLLQVHGDCNDLLISCSWTQVLLPQELANFVRCLNVFCKV